MAAAVAWSCLGSCGNSDSLPGHTFRLLPFPLPASETQDSCADVKLLEARSQSGQALRLKSEYYLVHLFFSNQKQ